MRLHKSFDRQSSYEVLQNTATELRSVVDQFGHNAKPVNGILSPTDDRSKYCMFF